MDEDGEEAVRKCRKGNPALPLMFVGLPGGCLSTMESRVTYIAGRGAVYVGELGLVYGPAISEMTQFLKQLVATGLQSGG